MGLIPTRVWFVFVGIAIFQYLRVNFYTQLEVTVDGSTAEEFQAVEHAFRKNFEDGWERDGSSLTVYRDGVKVVDLWGGYADVQAARNWKQDTLTVVFSTTKAVAALCVALLVQRGYIGYDDPVAKVWPAFSKHGKGNITLQMILSHTAGLAWFDTVITPELAGDSDKMREVIENEKPKWPAGSKVGYHAYTYGWLVDQVVRHADPSHRSIGQFFKDEFGQKYDIDFHIGLPLTEHYRVARITTPPMLDRLSEVARDYRVLRYFRALFDLMDEKSALSRTVGNPDWLKAVHSCTLNNPDYQRLEQAAALGIGNARSLAKLFDKLSTTDIFSEDMIQRLVTPLYNTTDFIMRDKLAKANGLLFFPLNRANAEFAVGHTGHGCQQVQYDWVNKITIAYTTNGLKTGLGHLCRTYTRLEDAVYTAIEKK